MDYVDRLALVIEDGDELVAVARYERYPDTPNAEVAFLVRDDYQHLGLGHRLLESLADAAWARHHHVLRRDIGHERRHDLSLSPLGFSRSVVDLRWRDRPSILHRADARQQGVAS